MATYKKRGYKPKKEKVVEETTDKTFDESKSDVAKTFEGLNEVASKSEQWIEKNSKPLFSGLVGIAVFIISYLAYNKFIAEPNELNASNEIAYPRSFFAIAEKAAGVKADSLYKLGLKGGIDDKYGFLYIAKNFGGTKAGNLANYYAGISYLRMKDYKNAISYLSNFDSNDELLGPTALGAIGDAFADINQPEEALEYYEKAANKKDNEFTAPLFLFKAGQTAMKLGKYKEAESFYITIKEKYATTQIGRDVDKYLNSAKYAK